MICYFIFKSTTQILRMFFKFKLANVWVMRNPVVMATWGMLASGNTSFYHNGIYESALRPICITDRYIKIILHFIILRVGSRVRFYELWRSILYSLLDSLIFWCRILQTNGNVFYLYFSESVSRQFLSSLAIILQMYMEMLLVSKA